MPCRGKASGDMFFRFRKMFLGFRGNGPDLRVAHGRVDEGIQLEKFPKYGLPFRGRVGEQAIEKIVGNIAEQNGLGGF